MSHLPSLNPVVDSIPGRQIPKEILGFGVVGLTLGFVGFAYGMFIAKDPIWTWGAFLVAFVYVMAIAQGGVIFGAMMNLTWARWGRPIKRIGEAFGAFLPLGYLLLVIFLVFGKGLYPWHEGTFVVDHPIPLEPHSPAVHSPAKEIWLQLPFFMARQLIAFGLLIVLDLLYIRTSILPDLIKAKEMLGSRAPALWDRWINGKTDLKDVTQKSKTTQERLAVIIAILYAFVFSFAAFDLIMSLAPWWFANMFGAWFFASSFWLALTAMGIFTLLTQDWLNITPFIKPSLMHDLGKLCFAFCMFWAYTLFAQILPIWYGNLPEETDFLLIRMMLPQWSWLAQLTAVLCFLAPFIILLSRGIKKMKWPFIGVLTMIMVGLFCERTLLVLPSVFLGDEFPLDQFLITSVGLWLGVLGALVLVASYVLSKVPPLVISDPYLEPHPWDVHVHSLDEAHH